MKKASTVLILIALSFVVIFLVIRFEVGKSKQESPSKVDLKTHFAYSNIVDLYGDLNGVKSWADDVKKYGGICSHHFFVSRQIADFFAGLKNNPPKTIVILGPNHFGVGNGQILVSLYPYQTPWGVVEPDLNLAQKLIQGGIVLNDEKPFKLEHSISALVGFIKYYLPQTKIVPIIFKLNTPQTNADKLADELIKNLDDDSFVLASVDFSHHVNRQTAIDQDKESIKAIENFDLEKIYDLKIDSPPSIYALLKYLKSKNALNVDYRNFNAADLLNNPNYQDVTSYVFAYFEK